MMAIDPAAFTWISEFVYKRSAIVLEPGKEYLVESRLSPLARDRGLPNIDALVAEVRAKPTGDLASDVVEAMTTNETSFFRDIHPFEAMKKTVVPDLLRTRAAERRINIWCGAASSGQEPYSIALLLRENFPQLSNWSVKLLATDISTEMIQRCHDGKFSQLEMNRGLPAAMLLKYFAKHGTEWQIDEQLRRSIDFQVMNLATNWPLMPQMDIIFLRNVLIYFDVETKKQILAKIRKLLKPDGVLFLGSAETTFNIDDGFERLAMDKATAYRIKP